MLKQINHKKQKLSRSDLTVYASTLSLIAIFTISFAVFTSTSTHADNTDTVDVINITVPSSCTMGGTIVTGEEHTTSLQPGTYEANIGKTTLTTYCNDPEGFSIYAIGFTGDQYSGENHTKLVGNTATNTISTGLTTGSSTTDASSWAMKLTTVNGTYAPTIMNGTGDTEDFTNYHVVPDDYTKVATFPSTTDAEGTGSIGSNLETTYAVYASLTQPADTYTGKVKYTLVHPATESAPLHPETTETGKICYYPNGSNVVGTMGCQDVASSIDLLASNFSRTGYGFAGWNTEYDYTGTFYGPNETISLNISDYSGTNPGLSLYAIWVKSEGSLQDSSKVASVCSSLTQSGPNVTPTLNSVSALTDQRDNNTYAIAKLADDKCWMIENLRLADKDSSNNDIELSTTNTNSPSLPLTNIYDATNPTTSNHLSASITPSSSTPWCTTSSAACYDQSMLYAGNTTERGTNPATSTNTYSYGNYYNWYSATAGNGKYSTSTNNSTVAGDICPTGWTLPEGGDKTNMAAEKNNFYKLGLSLGLSAPANYDSQTRPYWRGSPEGSDASTIFRTYPNNFLYSGNVYGSSVNTRGSYGYYWSKSAYSSNYAYSLYFGSSYVYPSSNGYYDSKYLGFTVRCLAQ